MLQLTEMCEVWRFVAETNGVQKRLQKVKGGLPCLEIPISDFDSNSPYARESTHVIFLPRWFSGVRKEDELRKGRYIDSAGTAQQYRFVVNGIKRYQTFGLRHVEVFCAVRA